MARKRKQLPERHQHTYRCLADVEKALNEYRAALEYDPGDNEIIDRALRAFLRSKWDDELPERQPSAE